MAKNSHIFLDKADPNLLHNEMTVTDHALTRPWTVMKNYRRNRNPRWVEAVCMEANPHVRIGKENGVPTPLNEAMVDIIKGLEYSWREDEWRNLKP